MQNTAASVLQTSPLRIPIQKLRPGQKAIVACLDGQAEDVARLAEMGLQSGTRVTVVRGGKTCILQLEDHRMCVRPSSELLILVNVE